MIDKTTLHRTLDTSRTVASLLTFITFQVLSVWASLRYIILIPQPSVDTSVQTSVALEAQLLYIMGVAGVFITVQLIGFLLAIGFTPEILDEYRTDEEA